MNKPQVASDRPIAVEVEEGRCYLWCACGKSKKQPWCDGAHQGTGIAPVAYQADANKTVYLCNCKQTTHAPMCDGAHQQLNDDGRDKYYQR
jgi:CDGSH-type Zn-finger protein